MLRWVSGIKNNKDNIVAQLKSHFLIGFAAQVIRELEGVPPKTGMVDGDDCAFRQRRDRHSSYNRLKLQLR